MDLSKIVELLQSRRSLEADLTIAQDETKKLEGEVAEVNDKLKLAKARYDEIERNTSRATGELRKAMLLFVLELEQPVKISNSDTVEALTAMSRTIQFFGPVVHDFGDHDMSGTLVDELSAYGELVIAPSSGAAAYSSVFRFEGLSDTEIEETIGKYMQFLAEGVLSEKAKDRLQGIVENLKLELQKRHGLGLINSVEIVALRTRVTELERKKRKEISNLLVALSKAERDISRRKVREDSQRLGKMVTRRVGTVFQEEWEATEVIKNFEVQRIKLSKQKEDVQQRLEVLNKQLSDAGGQQELTFEIELHETNVERLQREEKQLWEAKQRYWSEVNDLFREKKRIEAEDASKFRNFQVLEERYVLLNLLGKRGFAEVFKGFDLVEDRHVACKIHLLNSQSNEDRNKAIIGHMIREHEIHKTLVHPNIVRLWEVLKMDEDTVFSILEYCHDKDLDALLKGGKVLTENEARIIITQIFRGLTYLSQRSQKIIHYDLKPANILLNEDGVVKISDFGLCKIIDSGLNSIELTSQGAGTNLYLPPECFEQRSTPTHICSKVDVWSAGVIFYQMVYGVPPVFGNWKALLLRTVLNAEIGFPEIPFVSNEAKDFIRFCLTYTQEERPDVLAIAAHPYLMSGD